ncbi:hypothetical protein [Burkholderia catarinensis]|uniref:hypothetical protein n=1 Tax=Burkholderia catarinensis TaxID=1108140 RepID=UPI001C58E771|nr:hypothetical protein [Burkholderia catarinensis]KAG8154507.1 hypothetical protein BFF94_007030 [Burkholderia catarinensis]
MSSHIPSHRAGTEAVRTDDARGPDGTPPGVARDAAQLDGDVVLSLLALIGGGGAELKDAAGGEPAQGQPAGTAQGPARDGAPLPRMAPGTPGMRGGATGPAVPGAGTGTATPTGILPALAGNAQAGDAATSGILPNEAGDTEQVQQPDLAGPEDAMAFPSAPEAGMLRPGIGTAWTSAVDAQAMLPTEGLRDIAPRVDVETAGAMRAPAATTTAFAGTAGPADTPPRAAADASPAQAGPIAVATGHAPGEAASPAPAPPTVAAPRMPTERRAEAAPPARAARDVMADAAGTAGRYASATVRRAGTLAAATGRSLAARGAALPGVRALEAGLVERGWMGGHARSSASSDDGGIGIGTGAGADAGDPSSVASGNEAAGVVNVVRFVVQAREWLGERRARAPAGGCPHRRSLRCRWYCRAGCTRRGA